MSADLIFHHEQNDKLINFMFKKATLEWSAFAGCFSEAQWQPVQAIWCPNGGLASLGVVVSGCIALWC